MHLIIPDDYQDAVRGLDCFARLNEHQVTVLGKTPRDPAALADILREADALVLIRERTPITRALLERLPRLKLISQTGRGIAHIDLPACTEHGVAVAVGGGSPVGPAELTWALLLAAVRHLPAEVAALKAVRWQTTLGRELRGRTLGIFGYGSIGALVASYGRAFGMHVLVWGREGSLGRAAADGFAAAGSQRDLFARSDAVSLHIKLNAETRGIVTADDLAAMRPDSVLVNTSRAELIAPGALVAALHAGRPGFAAVDVYESEPALGHPLLDLPNAIGTPHLGYVTRETYEQYFGDAFDHALDYFAGWPVDLLNPETRGGGKL